MAVAKRFASSSGGEYRFALWFGRALTLASLWPTWYAFWGKSGFDWQAIMFGAPMLIGGLLSWRWGGYRLRNPLEYLEIDRPAGVARLVRKDGEPQACRLDELGAWRFDTWKTSHRHDGTRFTTTWHGVGCAGFGPARLFASQDADACRRWCAWVDAAARSFDATGWSFAESEVQATLRRHGLRERDELLWTATGLVPRGTSELDPAALEAAARSLTETTVAVRIAERLDDAQSKIGSVAALVGLIAGTLLLASLVVRPLLATDESPPEAAVLLALALGGVTLGWRAVKGPVVAAVLASLVGAAYVAKPWFAPIVREYDGALHAMSPTSETHLYYVVPGVGLILLAIGLLTTIKVRKQPPALTTTTARGQAVALEPPRPEPPQPPGK